MLDDLKTTQYMFRMKKMYDAILCCRDEERKDKIVRFLDRYSIGLFDKIVLDFDIPPVVGGPAAEASALSKLAADVVGFPGLGEATAMEVMSLPGKRYRLDEKPGKIRDMIRLLRGVDDRRAKIVTVMVLTLPSGRQKRVKGELSGWIVEKTKRHSVESVFVPDSFSAPLSMLSSGVRDGISSLRRAATKMNGVLGKYAA